MKVYQKRQRESGYYRFGHGAYVNMKKSAKNRCVPFSITEEELALWWKSNCDICAYCGSTVDEYLEIKEFIKNNYWRAKHVLIQVGADVATGDLEKSEAEKILERAKNGEDFDKLVEEFSQDPGSKTNPDGYVFTEKEMVPEFEEGTKSIQPGEFTLVKTSYGYHVIQRLPLDESDEKFAELFENTKTSAASKYTEKKFDELLNAYAEENGVTVEVNEEVVSKMTAPEVDTDTEE